MTEEDKLSPRASIILQKEFSHLPPTLIIVAELDPLRDGCFGKYQEELEYKHYRSNLVLDF